MKKNNRFGVLLGLLAGASVIAYVPAAFAQESEPGPAAEMMDNGVDISMQGPGMPPPGMMPGMPPFQGSAVMMGEPDEILSMHPGGDLMLIRAGVHGAFTDDQLEKMYRLKSEFMDVAGMKMAELRMQEHALHDLLTQPDFEKGKLQSIQNKINGLRNEIANLRLDEQVGFLNCLTADQRKELRRSYVKHMDFGMMGMHPGMHGGMRGGMHHGMHGGAPGPWGGHEDGGHEHHEHHDHDGPPPSSGDKG